MKHLLITNIHSTDNLSNDIIIEILVISTSYVAWNNIIKKINSSSIHA